MPEIDPIQDAYINSLIKVAQEGNGKTTGEGLRVLIKALRDRFEQQSAKRKITVSTLPPTGVPTDGEEWVMYSPDNL